MSKTTMTDAFSSGLCIVVPELESTAPISASPCRTEGSLDNYSGALGVSSCNAPHLLQRLEADIPVPERSNEAENQPLGADLIRRDTLVAGNLQAGGMATLSELKVLLGNAQSRLRSGAMLLDGISDMDGPSNPNNNAILLERATSQARVNLDLFLDHNISVQGGALSGNVEIRVRKHPKQRYPILLSGGKLRVVGFESIMEGEERSAFYQCSASLAQVTSGTSRLYISEPDEEGFARTADGTYLFPFFFRLPLTKDEGTPKGILTLPSGASIRYIVMVSFRIKDSVSGKKSIAHFYRDCIIWPRLDPSLVLSPATNAIQASTSWDTANSKSLLTIALCRPYAIAGQIFHVQIKVSNNSKKLLKNAAIELFQSTTIYRPLRRGTQQQSNMDLDLQATTINKKISESVLKTCQLGTKAHASAKGWWAGVSPGESQTFIHSILIPAEALSIPRTRLLEVTYMLQAVISTGTLSSSDTHVALPIQIINFLSIDPPPVITAPQASRIARHSQGGSTIREIGPRSGISSKTELPEIEFDRQKIPQDSKDDPHYQTSGNLPMQDDDDRLVHHVISSAGPGAEDAPMSGDMNYGSLQGNLDRGAEGLHQRTTSLQSHQPEPRKPNGFASRVEEKLHTRMRGRMQSGSENGKPPSLGAADLDFRREARLDSANSADRPASSSAIGRYGNSSIPSFSLDAGSRFARKQPDLPPTADHGRTLDEYTRQHRRKQSSSNQASLVSDNRSKVDKNSAAVSRPPAVRTLSVKDKIRELEERCASADLDN